MPSKVAKSASRRDAGSKSVEFSIDSLSDMAGKLSYEETLPNICEALYTRSDAFVIQRCSLMQLRTSFLFCCC